MSARGEIMADPKMRVKDSGPESGKFSGRPPPARLTPFSIDGGRGPAYTEFFTHSMKLLPLLSAAALLSGCASAPPQDEERPSQAAKDPAKIHGFFLRKIR